MIPKILTVSTRSVIIKMSQTNEVKRKESRLEVKTYLDRLKYALENGSATINYQEERRVDQKRNKRYTNRFTVAQLFPDDDEIEALKRELSHLTVEEYIETVKDTRCPKRSEMRVFGKQYSGDDVYIKIRVELVSTLANGANYIFVMSFHYSEWDFKESDFPYKKV